MHAQLFPNSKAEEIQSLGVENIDLLLALATGKLDFTVTDRGIGEKFTSEQVQKLHHDITRPEQYVINFEYLRRRAIRNMAS